MVVYAEAVENVRVGYLGLAFNLNLCFPSSVYFPLLLVISMKDSSVLSIDNETVSYELSSHLNSK